MDGDNWLYRQEMAHDYCAGAVMCIHEVLATRPWFLIMCGTTHGEVACGTGAIEGVSSG
jgi:hypothetical protein